MKIYLYEKNDKKTGAYVEFAPVPLLKKALFQNHNLPHLKFSFYNLLILYSIKGDPEKFASQIC